MNEKKYYLVSYLERKIITYESKSDLEESITDMVITEGASILSCITAFKGVPFTVKLKTDEKLEKITGVIVEEYNG